MKRNTTSQAELSPQVNVAASAGDEIDLVQLWLILWKRKLMIIALTSVLTVIGSVVVMVLPKVYKITAIIEPAKDADGKPVERTEVIKENVLGGAYDQQLQKKYNLSIEEYPEWHARIPKGTNLLEISVESLEPEQTVVLLNGLISLVSVRIEERLQMEKQRSENLIKLAEIKHNGLRENIKLLTMQTHATSGKIGDLEKVRQKALASHSTDAMAVLLYSNEIQSQQIYLNNLQLQLKRTEQQLSAAAIEVDDARLKLDQIKSTNINKYPTVPNKPIKPKKILIVLLTFMLGLMGSVLLACLFEYIQCKGKQA